MPTLITLMGGEVGSSKGQMRTQSSDDLTNIRGAVLSLGFVVKRQYLLISNKIQPSLTNPLQRPIFDQ